jgi:ATP-dependent RNA helicase DeaD
MATFEDLHLSAPIAAALERLGWSPNDGLVKEAVPTAARGHNLIAVTPPAPVYGTPTIAGFLSRLITSGRGLLLAPPAQLGEWGALANGLSQDTGIRIQVAHGTGRVSRHLRADSVDLVITTPEVAVLLAGRSVLRTESVAGLFLAWPDAWLDPDLIMPLMQDLPKEAQRIIHTSNPAQVGPLSERYARKALAVGSLEDGVPIGPLRTVSVPWSRRVESLAEVVELLDPGSLVIWTADRAREAVIGLALPVTEPLVRLASGDAPAADVVVAFDLPTPDRLRQLLSAGEVVLLVPPDAESYVSRVATQRRPLQLSSALENALAAARDKRAAIVRALQQGSHDQALLTLAPLFERYDPVRVAAALFQLWGDSAGSSPAPLRELSATAKIYVGVGKRDGVTANDLVAVLTKELRVDRTKIGRIELREAYSLIEIPASEAETVAGALNGVVVRRKRVTARVDRGPTRLKGGKALKR